MIESSIQTYLKDAIRNVEIKIFKAVIESNGASEVYYFTNRLEIGHITANGQSVYEKLKSIRNIVNAGD